MHKGVIKLLIISMVVVCLIFGITGCSKSIEGIWYEVIPEYSNESDIDELIDDLTSDVDDKTYVVKEKVDVTEDHFFIDGEAYTYTIDEDYVIVSNDHTYKLENDDTYGEVLKYEDEIIAYKDKEKAQMRAEELASK